MLALPPLRNINNERTNEMAEDFPDFSAGCNLLDSIDFDQLFDVGINQGDVLPDLEMDPEIFADFCEDSDFHFSDKFPQHYSGNHSASDAGEDNNSVVNKLSGDFMNQSPKQSADKGKKASTTNSTNKNAQGKRKVKVDWTPELHRRFVQAVEQLGVDKAVPSRILDLMGIQGLTRHNIASHLQKYRSHRKHMQAREAEAANWNQRRQVYRGPPPGGAANGGKLRDGVVTPSWVAPTIGFPPVAPMPPHFRPLHVWGHPSVDQSSLVHMWPKHIASSPPSWPPLQPSIITNNPSFWHPHHQHAFQRFSSPAIPGIPPASMYKVDPGIGFAAAPIGQTMPKPSLDVQPTKESVDAALGDVLAKPWLPLPLGLRPPSTDSVLGALQRQGVSKIPTTTT